MGSFIIGGGIPMALGGHLVPGNLVALCRSCNHNKLDLPPEEFYTPGELERLKSILDQQEEVFSFTFDWDSWHEDREDYLLSLGVEAGLVQAPPKPTSFLIQMGPYGFKSNMHLHGRCHATIMADKRQLCHGYF